MRSVELADAIGERIRDMRERHGLTAERIANAAQQLGARWTIDTIYALEHGGANAGNLGTMVVAFTALEKLTGEQTTAEDIFKSGELYELVPGVEATGNTFHTMVNELYFEPAETAYAADPALRQLADDLAAKGVDAGMVPDDFIAPIKGLQHAHSLSEKRQARKLGMPPSIFCAWCILVCGDYLDAATTKQAGESASAQKRGRVTRQIIRQIQQERLEQFESLNRPQTRGEFTADETREWFAANFPEVK